MAESQAQKLDGWKDIARYLGKDQSTVMRWARRRGMPVHRLPGAKGATVYAYPKELDDWLQNSNGAANSPNADAASTNADAAVLQAGTDQDRRSAWSRKYALLMIPAVLLVASVAFFSLSSRPSRFDSSLPAQVNFNGNKLSALDAAGRVLWEHEFRNKLEKPAFELAQTPRFADIDGDGRQEVLVTIAFPDETMRDVKREALYCLSPAGKLLWSYEANLTLAFSSRSYEGPWLITDVLIVPEGNRNDIWVSLTHHTWWPSFLVKLDTNGNPNLQFVDSGAIYALTYVRNESGSYVLAGGVNNEYSAGMLAVIDERQQAAVSPQTPGSAFSCDNCPNGNPYRYFIFPRSELNLLGNHPYNPVRRVRASENQIEISTDEVPHEAGMSVLMTKNFAATSVAIGDGYADFHRRLSEQGKISHALKDCPMFKQPYPVRVWDVQRGWSQMAVPWVPGRRE